jgi:hypothetical protein
LPSFDIPSLKSIGFARSCEHDISQILTFKVKFLVFCHWQLPPLQKMTKNDKPYIKAIGMLFALTIYATHMYQSNKEPKSSCSARDVRLTLQIIVVEFQHL